VLLLKCCSVVVEMLQVSVLNTVDTGHEDMIVSFITQNFKQASVRFSCGLKLLSFSYIHK